METRMLRAGADGSIVVGEGMPPSLPADGWIWLDVRVDSGDALAGLAELLMLDQMAVRDAVDDYDLPKVDDFGHHLLVILHGLRDDDVETYEVDCFLTERVLVTVHSAGSPALDTLWQLVQERPELARGGLDELLARIADVLTRRLQGVLDAFEARSDELIEKALEADPDLVGELTAVRSDLSTVRRVMHPQREALDVLRSSTSPLIDAAGRRRFSDAFDLALRASGDLDAARASLAEILDAYRGAEAREATDVTRVLTIYAAIMLPLSLVAGFFGMNFSNLPWIGREWGWIVVTIGMAVIALVSLGVFVALGWMRRPSGRTAGATLGRGLIEAARAPAQVVGAAYEISTMPLRATTRIARPGRRSDEDR